jgi:hypothetical protein
VAFATKPWGKGVYLSKSRGASELAARINLRELYRRAIKLPLKWLGHAIEDWVPNQSPMGNSSIIDTKAFEWVERLEKNSGVIRQEMIALLSGQTHLPNIQELSPRQMNLSKANGWKTFFSSSWVIASKRATDVAQRRVNFSIPFLMWRLRSFRYLRLECTSSAIVVLTKV